MSGGNEGEDSAEPIVKDASKTLSNSDFELTACCGKPHKEKLKASNPVTLKNLLNCQFRLMELARIRIRQTTLYGSLARRCVEESAYLGQVNHSMHPAWFYRSEKLVHHPLSLPVGFAFLLQRQDQEDRDGPKHKASAQAG